METERLYRVKKEDLPKLEELLTECFSEDPLYQKLIPDKKVRMKLLPQLMKCDLTEYFSECEIYADSAELNSIIVVSDESESYNPIEYYMDTWVSQFKTDSYLIKEDPSLKTFYNFIVGKDYLNSKWTDELRDTKRLHIIYLAVRPSMQHHGISGHLLDEVMRYADMNGLMISLETHNDKNLPLYEHHGFEVYKILNKHFGLKQYCMIRKHKSTQQIQGFQLNMNKV